MKPSSVLIFQRIVPHYRVPFFRALFEKAGIRVCHSRENKKSSLKSQYSEMDFDSEWMSRIYFGSKETAVVQNILLPLVKHRPQVVISEFAVAYVSMWLLWIFRPIFRYRLILWTHGVTNRDVLKPFSSWKGKLTLWFFHRCDGIFVYSEPRKTLLQKHLSKEIPISVIPNTLSSEVGHFDQSESRNMLDANEEFQLVFSSRLLETKRIDLVLETYDQLKKEFPGRVGLHVIGDGPERFRVTEREPDSSLYFWGAVYDSEKVGRIISCADLMLCPGEVGLSVIHGFSQGVPTLTLERTEKGPWHGPEFDWIENCSNGLISSESSYSSTAVSYFRDQELQRKMRQGALDTFMTRCDFWVMVNRFLSSLASF